MTQNALPYELHGSAPNPIVQIKILGTVLYLPLQYDAKLHKALSLDDRAYMRGCRVSYLGYDVEKHRSEVAHMYRGERRVENLALLLVLCAIGRKKPRSDSQITRASNGVSETAKPL